MDLQNERIVSFIWSGEDVLKHTYNLSIFEKIFEALNQNNFPRFVEESKGRVMKKKLNN